MINMTPKNILIRTVRIIAGLMFTAALILFIPGGIVAVAAWAITRLSDVPVDTYTDDVPLPPGIDIDE